LWVPETNLNRLVRAGFKNSQPFNVTVAAAPTFCATIHSVDFCQCVGGSFEARTKHNQSMRSDAPIQIATLLAVWQTATMTRTFQAQAVRCLCREAFCF
jgi:hypothetical protein